MGEREIPADDRGLPDDATREAAHLDLSVEEALSIMNEKFAHLEGREQRLGASAQVQEAEKIVNMADEQLDSIDVLGREITELMNIYFQEYKPKNPQAPLKPLFDIQDRYDQGKIGLDEFRKQLVDFRDGLKGKLKAK